MTQVYVSIGSNQLPEQHIQQALTLLEERFGALALSPVYESRAVGFDGDNFLNLVIRFETELPLQELGELLDDIEQQCGRIRNQQRFSPRTMDLDLLLYGDRIYHDDGWDIPRREIYEYAFVAKPLADLAPQMVHPETGQTFAAVWEGGDFDGQELHEVKLS